MTCPLLFVVSDLKSCATHARNSGGAQFERALPLHTWHLLSLGTAAFSFALLGYASPAPFCDLQPQLVPFPFMLRRWQIRSVCFVCISVVDVSSRGEQTNEEWQFWKCLFTHMNILSLHVIYFKRYYYPCAGRDRVCGQLLRRSCGVRFLPPDYFSEGTTTCERPMVECSLSS